jgi:hypothetical protein
MSTSNFTQTQREALINLLALGMYADGHLSLKEDEALLASLESLAWDSGTSRGTFLDDAISRASHADTDEKFDAYLGKCAGAFTTSESKQLALDSLNKLLNADGSASGEAPFVARVKKALGA